MEEIINKVPSTWSKDLIIRYLYIKLAPYFKRDLMYFLATEEEKYKEYSQGFINRFPNIVCSTLADYYVNLFKEFGINAKKVAANSAKIPLFALIVEGDLGWYFLDPLSDLFSNQYGLKPYFFGIIPRYNTIQTNHPEIINLPPEYIKELDDTLDIKYLDSYFAALHNELAHQRNAKIFFGIPTNAKVDLKERKLQFYNNELINIGNVHGPYERSQLYKYLNDRILNRGEKRFTKIRLLGGYENPHISIELINPEEHIFYEEEKHDNQYVLTKKL